MNTIERLADDISSIHETADDVLQIAENTKYHNPDLGATLSSFSLLLKSQAVLAEVMLEILKEQQQPQESTRVSKDD